MVALITVASLGKLTTALLSFGSPVRWRLGKNSRHASSSSSWSGEEIIRAIRHEAQMTSSSSPLLPRTRYLGTQALLKINKVIQQQQQQHQADLQQQQSMMKQQRQNDTDTDTSTTTGTDCANSASDVLQQSSKQQQQPHKFSRRLTVQVCLSPGCIADGADVTMEKLQALAPAHVRIQQGGCSSFCGSGPVVVTLLEEQAPSSSSGQRQRPVLVEQKSHKRIQNDKILRLVYPTAAATNAENDDEEVKEQSTAAAASAMNGPPPDLVQGYDLVLKGDALFANMEYAKAIECYEEAVRVAFTSAVELQNERDRFRSYWAQHHPEEQQQQHDGENNDESDNVEDTTCSTDMVNYYDDFATMTTTASKATTRIPVELEWLIRARRNEARCKLELGNDIEGAVLAAQASCNLSRNTSSESFHVLAEVYRYKQDLIGEMQALQKMLSLPPPSSSSTTTTAAYSVRSQRQQQFAMENQRRIAGIRLQKLEREYQSQK